MNHHIAQAVSSLRRAPGIHATSDAVGTAASTADATPVTAELTTDRGPTPVHRDSNPPATAETDTYTAAADGHSAEAPVRNRRPHSQRSLGSYPLRSTQPQALFITRRQR
eukprot:4511710-Pleurochrysis_carterae.AAC.1